MFSALLNIALGFGKRSESLKLFHQASCSGSLMELQGGQGHSGRARGIQGKAREGLPRAHWGPPGSGPPLVPLASLELHQATLTRGLY